MIKAEEMNNLSPEGIQVNSLLGTYNLHLVAGNRSEKTRSWYEQILTKYFAFLESTGVVKPITELSQTELKSYILDLQQRKRWPNNKHTHDEKPLSPHTIAGHVRAIKAFWSWLFNEEYITSNPLAEFPLPKVPQNIIKILTVADMKKLLNAVDRSTPAGDRLYCVLLLLIDMGARISEVVNIKIPDVNLSQCLVRVIGKGMKERIIPFQSITRKALLKYMDNSRPHISTVESDYLFPTKYGERISVNSVQQALRRLGKKLGFSSCHPHLFRHTFATLFIANNGSPPILKEIMGHSSFQTTEKYIHPKTEDLQKQHKLYSPLTDMFK